MPIYLYECSKEECQTTCEIVSQFSELKNYYCSECGSIMNRIPSKNTFILGNKGNIGWAKNGYSQAKQKEIEE